MANRIRTSWPIGHDSISSTPPMPASPAATAWAGGRFRTSEVTIAARAGTGASTGYPYPTAAPADRARNRSPPMMASTAA